MRAATQERGRSRLPDGSFTTRQSFPSYGEVNPALQKANRHIYRPEPLTIQQNRVIIKVQVLCLIGPHFLFEKVGFVRNSACQKRPKTVKQTSGLLDSLTFWPRFCTGFIFQRLASLFQ